MSTAATNASGLTPEKSRALKERAAKPEEEKLLKGIKEMYSCNPEPTTFDIYTEDAIFHDPVGYAEGKKSISAQFIGLAKIFDKADIPKFRVLETPSTLDPSTILVDQDVAYYSSADKAEPTKTLNSLLTLKVDPTSGKITSHTEEWNHNKQTLAEDGVLGWFNEKRKKLTAQATNAAVDTSK